MAVTFSLKPSPLSLVQGQSSHPCGPAPGSTRAGSGLRSPTGRPRMCWGDGRAKRNRRVSWLMTCREARAVRRPPGQGDPRPPSSQRPV